MIGVTVKVVGTQNTGAITDLEGNFTISLPSGNRLFVFCICESVSVWLCLSICFTFWIAHLSDTIWYLSFLV